MVAWNGMAGFYHHYPIKVRVGDLVRVYVINMLEYEPLGSFHLHAETFDVYPAGMGAQPAFRDDTIALAQGQRAMIEFTLPHYGRYMFHPHQHWLATEALSAGSPRCERGFIGFGGGGEGAPLGFGLARGGGLLLVGLFESFHGVLLVGDGVVVAAEEGEVS